jgi:hypothetical protein
MASSEMRENDSDQATDAPVSDDHEAKEAELGAAQSNEARSSRRLPSSRIIGAAERDRMLNEARNIDFPIGLRGYERAAVDHYVERAVGPGLAVGGILASTAYDGTRIYGTDSADAQVLALSLSGASQWNSLDPSTLDFSPVAIANGVLYSVDPAGFLIARDPATGLVLNALNLGGLSFGGVSAVGDALYATVGTGPPPEPAPPQDGSGSIIAFGDTSHSGAD